MSLFDFNQVTEIGDKETIEMITQNALAIPYNLHLYQIRHLRVDKDLDYDGKPMLFDTDSQNATPYNYGDKSVVHNNGGVTIVTLRDVTSNRLYTGVSICSMRDQFCKKSGIYIATTRALLAYKHGFPIVVPDVTRCQLFDNKENRNVIIGAIPYECFMLRVS